MIKINTYFGKLNRITYYSNVSILLHKLFSVNTIPHLINELQSNRRRNVVKFGSEISIIILVKFIRDNNIATKIIFIEYVSIISSSTFSYTPLSY